MPHFTECQTAYTDELEDDEAFEFNGINGISHTNNNNSTVYMHAGVCSEHVDEESSGDEAEGDQPLIRELDLEGVVAQVPDLLEPTPEHQPTVEDTTPSQQHVAPGERGETERVHTILRHLYPCMILLQ